MTKEYEEQKTRQFQRAIFMGDGERSVQACDLLRKRLDDALSFLSGSQQPPMATDPEGSHQRHLKFMNEADMVICTAVQDIAAALTGKEWVPAEGQELSAMERALLAQQFCRETYGRHHWFIDAVINTEGTMAPSVDLLYEKTDVRFTYASSYEDIIIQAVEAGEE